MPVGGLDSYFLRGQRPEEVGDDLDEAAQRLVDFWLSRPSLVPLLPGNVHVTLTIGGRTVEVEITDPNVIREMMSNPRALLDEVARHADLPVDAARLLLSQGSAVVRVDTIMDPSRIDAWRPGQHANGAGAPPPELVLPGEVPKLIAALVREADQEQARGRRRKRTAAARQLISLAIEQGVRRGQSDAAIAKALGLPRTTVRDARVRAEGERRVRTELAGRKTGARLSPTQRELVRRELQRTNNNAAQAARNLGLPPKTVRDLRARQEQRVAPAAPARRVGPTERAALTSKLVAAVQGGQTATEAGRALGLSDRTSRRWVQQARAESDRRGR